MSSNYSGRTTPHSDVDHPHRITYSPFNKEEDPQPVPMLPPQPPTPGPIALESRATQTSPKPCPIHQQHVAIMTIHTPPFARQIQQPPTLQEALELRELLCNPDLQIPITTHCELHSLIFTLHRAYRNLISDENQHPNEKQRKTLEANIIESLHQIDALDSSEISNRSQRNIAEEPSAPTATNWDIGRRTAVFTNAPTATSINPTTKNIYAFFDPSDHTADPKPLSNKNYPPHHLFPSASPTREDSKTENPPHPSPLRPPHHRPTEESTRTRERERERKRTIIHANKERPKETSTKPSMK